MTDNDRLPRPDVLDNLDDWTLTITRDDVDCRPAPALIADALGLAQLQLDRLGLRIVVRPAAPAGERVASGTISENDGPMTATVAPFAEAMDPHTVARAVELQLITVDDARYLAGRSLAEALADASPAIDRQLVDEDCEWDPPPPPRFTRRPAGDDRKATP